MASFVAVVVGVFLLFFFRGGGVMFFFKKRLFLLLFFFLSFFDGKSVMSALCTYHYMCMFVQRGPVGRLGHGLKPSSSQ